MESEENCQNYKRVYHWISWFEDSNRAENFRTFKIALNILYYIYIYYRIHSYQCPNIFSLEWKRTEEENDEAIGFNEPGSDKIGGVHAIERWATIKESLQLEGTEFTDSAVDRSSVERFNVSSNDNCYIILWEFAAFEKGKISSIDSRIQMALSGTRFWSAIAHE